MIFKTISVRGRRSIRTNNKYYYFFTVLCMLRCMSYRVLMESGSLNQTERNCISSGTERIEGKEKEIQREQFVSGSFLCVFPQIIPPSGPISVPPLRLPLAMCTQPESDKWEYLRFFHSQSAATLFIDSGKEELPSLLSWTCIKVYVLNTR